MTEHNTFEPGWVSHPGETMADILQEQRLTPKDFAQRIGQTPDYARALLHGQVAITAPIAKQLAVVLGGTATFWTNREAQYRQGMARLRNQLDAAAARKFVKELPINDMIQFGWLQPAQNAKEKASAALQFFGVPDIDAWHESYADVLNTPFRTSPAFRSDPGAVAAWIRQGELEASSIECMPWDTDKFRATLRGIRELTRQKEPSVFLTELQKRSAECGVAVIIVRAPDKCRASGAVWISPRNRRLILLSCRYLTDDQFWFSFFHEAGHLLLHDTKLLLLEGVGAISQKEEHEANAFAGDILIPPQYRNAMLALPVDGKAVMRFAKDIGVSPGIVVGQMQHYERLTERQLNNLKMRFQWKTSKQSD